MTNKLMHCLASGYRRLRTSATPGESQSHCRPYLPRQYSAPKEFSLPHTKQTEKIKTLLGLAGILCKVKLNPIRDVPEFKQNIFSCALPSEIFLKID